MNKELPLGLRDGFTQISNEILESLMYADLTKREYKICLCILRYGYGYKKEKSEIVCHQRTIAKLIGLNEVVIKNSLNLLEDKNIIKYDKLNKTLSFNRHISTWKLNKTLSIEERKLNKTLSKNLTKRKVKLNETLTSTSEKDSGNKGSRGSKESKESIKESKPKPCEAENLASPSSLPGRPARQGKETKESEISQIRQVFKYWQQTFNHPKALLSKDRAGKIRARLRNGYNLSQLKHAIDGCKASSYHMGDNDAGKVYDSIGLIFRNAEKLEDFWGYLKKKEQSYDKLIEKYSND